MGNIVFNVNTKVAFFFEHDTRAELDPKIAANNGDVPATSKEHGGVFGVVVQFTTIGNITGPPDIIKDSANRKLTLVYPYYGHTVADDKRKVVSYTDLGDLPPQYLTTIVTFEKKTPPGGIVTYSESESHTTAVPPSEQDVISLADDE